MTVMHGDAHRPGTTPKHSLAMRRTGTGPPLVLLHALGSSSHAWEPVLPALRDRFEVITVDLPGFGGSPALSPRLEPTPAALAAAVATAIDQAGVHNPHVVGNSIGGWVALELAQIRALATLTLISPAGMWPGNTPWYCRVSLHVTRWLTEHIPSVLNRLVNYGFGRVLILGQSHGRPTLVTADQGRAAIAAMGTCVGFAATLKATAHLRYQAARVDRERLPPTTVAFGSRDLILLRRGWRRTDELPPETVTRTLHRCGHIPMADDPAAVADLISASATTPSVTGASGK